MFGFLKKNLNVEMKNLVAVAALVNALEIKSHFLRIAKEPSIMNSPLSTLATNNYWFNNIAKGDENEICMKLASATTNYLFNHPFQQMHIEIFTEEVIVEEAMNWLEISNSFGDKNFCKLIVQSLRVLNTLEHMNNKDGHTKIIGEDILAKYGKNYSEAPNPKNYKQLISDLARFSLDEEDLNFVISFASKQKIKL